MIVRELKRLIGSALFQVCDPQKKRDGGRTGRNNEAWAADAWAGYPYIAVGLFLGREGCPAVEADMAQ